MQNAIVLFLFKFYKLINYIIL